MSETTSTRAAGSCGPACEGESLIIEVIGKDHPDGHSFRIFDESDNEQQEWLENQVQVEDLGESMLHVWPWKDQPQRNVWIEIDSEESPIRVPFLRNKGAVERQLERQRHVILPVIPTTLISGVELKGDNPVHHVMPRTGFLYLFHEGTLWRELEIKIDEQGVTTYHDVPVQQYRNSDRQLKPGYRDVTGTGLSDIWLPASISGNWLTIEAAYSESPWPGERVNHLERSDGDRRQRCNRINMRFDPDSKEDVADLRISNGNTTAFLAEELAPQRPRKPAVEWQFDRPEKYLLDTEGAYPETAMAAALSMHQRQEDPDPEDPITEDERPEMTALANCLHKTVQEVERANALECRAEEEEPFTWHDSLPGTGDCTESAKARAIGVIRLDDPLYQLRYNHQRRQVAAWFVNAAVRRARARPYFDSAMLVNAVLEPEFIGGKRNELHEHMSEVVGPGRKEFERSIALSERTMARGYLDQLHDDLLNRLSDPRTQHVLTDLFTHYSYDYAGAFKFVSSLIMNLVTEPGECDAMDTHAEGAVDGQGKQWLEGLCEGKHSRMLYSLLFPRFSSEDLESPYEPPSEPNPNHGNGLFRETELAALEGRDLPEFEEIKTIDGLELTVEAAAGAYDTLLSASLRMGGQALMGIHGNLWVAIHHASLAIYTRNTDLKNITEELEELRLEKTKLENQRWARERSINNLNGKVDELTDIRDRLANLESQHEALLRQKGNLNERAILGQMKLYSNSMEQLRRSLPGLLGKMELMRLSKALQKEYFIFEISSRRPAINRGSEAIRLFGDVFNVENAKDASGQNTAEASTSRRRAQAAGVASDVAEEAYVLVLPKTEEIAQMIERVSAAESRYLDAVHKLTELEDVADLNPNAPAAAAAVAARRLDAAKAEVAQAEQGLKDFDRDMGNQRDVVHQREKYVGDVEAANDAANRVDQAEIDSKRSGRLYRVLNKPVFPVFVAMLEIQNASSVWAASSREERVKGRGVVFAGYASAAVDLAAATAAISERWALGPSKVLSLTPSGKFGKMLERRLGAALTVRSGLGVAAGFLMAIDSGLDALYEHRMGNHAAAVGHGLLAGSGLAFGFASLVGKAGTFLVLGPAAWLAVGAALAVSGLVIVFMFSDEPLDIWMRHGPFGALNEKPFLKEPFDAYHRLISLLMGVSVRLEFNPLRRAAQLGELDETDNERISALAAAKDRLVVESAIPGLFGSNGFAKTISKLQLKETIATSKGRNGHVGTNRFTGEAVQEYILLQEASDSGVHLYLNTPDSSRQEIEPSFFGRPGGWETKTYQWSARIQIQAWKDAGEKLMVFPAPPPDDPRTYNSDDEYAEPDFSSRDQPFWFSEKVRENA